MVKQLGGKKPKGHKKACKCVICKRGGADTVSMDDKTLSASDDVDEDESATMDNKKDDVVKDDEPVEGVEDARLFWHQDKWWILGASRDFASSGSIRQMLAEVRDELSPTLDHPWRLPSPLTSDDSASVYEKNWVPMALSPSSLDVVWSTDPFVQLRLDALTRQVVPVAGRSTALATHDLRGSTPVFMTPHGPVYVVHEVGPAIHEGDRPHRTYLHRFVTYCDDHVLIGQPWTIEGLALEYVAGAAFLNDTLYLSYGRDDQLAKVAVSSWDEISHLIQKSC
jgi:hypothetical protein